MGYNTDYIGAISAIEDGIGGFYNRNSGAIFLLFFGSHGKISDKLCFTGPGSKDAAISPLAGRLVVVVGAGGAGKAIAYGAKEKVQEL